MKCNTCKNIEYCNSYCFGFQYEASLYKLIIRKIKNKIIKILGLEK